MKYPFTGKVQSHNKQKWFSSILEITCNLYLFTFMSCISFVIFYSFKLRYRFISMLWPEALAEFLAISLRWFIAKERISWFQSGLKVEPSVRRLTSSHVSSQPCNLLWSSAEAPIGKKQGRENRRRFIFPSLPSLRKLYFKRAVKTWLWEASAEERGL